MSPTDGTFIHVDASMNKLLKAFSLAKVKQRFVLLGNFVDTNFDLFWKHKFIFYEEEKKVFETFANTARWKNSIFFSLHQILKPYLKDCVDNGTWFETWILIVGNMLLLFVYSMVCFNLNLLINLNFHVCPYQLLDQTKNCYAS